MLTQESLKSALPLAERLDNRKMFLTAIPGSPLDVLVKATRSDNRFNIDGGNSSYTPDIVNIDFIANAKDPVLGVSPHDTAMDELVAVAGKAVQSHMLHARTVVAPAVIDLAEKVMASLNELTPSMLLGMEVVTWSPPKPLENSTFEKSVRRFEEVPYDTPALAMRLPTIAASEIIELLNTGSSGVDGDIAEWVGAKGESFFIKIWERVFQIQQAELNEGASLSFRDWMEDRENGLDNALAIHLLSRRLADNPLPETEMNLGQFNDLIIQFRDQSGARLVRGMEMLDRDMKQGIMVMSTTDRVTIVNSNLYRSWIEAGGCNEILYGNLLDLPAAVTVDALSAKAEKLKSAWNHHAALTVTVETNRRYNRTKDLLAKHFADQVRGVEDPEEATIGNQELVLKLFGDLLNEVRAEEMDNLYMLSLKLVCRSRFYRTEAERILAGIERVKKDNPNIDVREAAAISMIEYISFWVATQFKVTAL